MDIEEARTFLRDQLTAAASQGVPTGQGPLVTDDTGPVAPDPALDGNSSRFVCYINVEVGDPADTRTPHGHVAATGEALASMGWQVTASLDDGKYVEMIGTRDGFTVAIRMWRGQRVLRLHGMTPVFLRPA
jgi:hypothetical protein